MIKIKLIYRLANDSQFGTIVYQNRTVTTNMYVYD